MTRKEIEDLVRHHPQPVPSTHLRDRVLSSAVVTPLRLTWSDRVWFSTRWRLGTVAAALVIVVLNLTTDQSASVIREPSRTRPGLQAVVDAGRQLGFSEEAVAALARREASVAVRTPVAPSVETLLDELMPRGGNE